MLTPALSGVKNGRQSLIRTNGTGRIRLHNVDGFDHADITFGQDATIKCDLLKIVPLSKAGTEQGDEAQYPAQQAAH